MMKTENSYSMKRRLQTHFWVLLGGLLFTTAVFGAADSQRDATQMLSSLPGFKKAIAVMKTAGAPLWLPAEIKTSWDNGPLYMNVDDPIIAGSRAYHFNLDVTPTCQMKLCTLLWFSAQPGTAPLPTYQNYQHQNMTSVVILQDGTRAYYTQGYPQADWWPAHIDWIKNGMTYDITSDHFDLVWMANHMKAF